jgi:hypothetical protein
MLNSPSDGSGFYTRQLVNFPIEAALADLPRSIAKILEHTCEGIVDFKETRKRTDRAQRRVIWKFHYFMYNFEPRYLCAIVGHQNASTNPMPCLPNADAP